MTDVELNAMYFRLAQGAYNRNHISKTCYENLIDRYGADLDEIERNMKDLTHAIEHGEYYITVDRITKGEEMLRDETNGIKKSEYRKLLNDLTVKLENLIPKDDAA